MNEKINKFIQNSLLGLLIAITILAIMFLIISFQLRKKYDDDLQKLNKIIENKEKKISELNKQLTDNINTIDKMLEENKKKQEVECDCGWYEDFYYNNAEGCGAYE